MMASNGASAFAKSGKAPNGTAVLSVAATVQERIDAKITGIERRLDAIGAHTAEVSHAANPEGDIGGIRSRSAMQRAQSYATYDKAARQTKDLIGELSGRRARKANYTKAKNGAEAFSKILNSGTYKGKPLDKRTRKEFEGYHRDQVKMMTRIEGEL